MPPPLLTPVAARSGLSVELGRRPGDECVRPDRCSSQAVAGGGIDQAGTVLANRNVVNGVESILKVIAEWRARCALAGPRSTTC